MFPVFTFLALWRLGVFSSFYFRLALLEDNSQAHISSSVLSLVAEENRESLNFETEILIFIFWHQDFLLSQRSVTMSLHCLLSLRLRCYLTHHQGPVQMSLRVSTLTFVTVEEVNQQEYMWNEWVSTEKHFYLKKNYIPYIYLCLPIWIFCFDLFTQRSHQPWLSLHAFVQLRWYCAFIYIFRVFFFFTRSCCFSKLMSDFMLYVLEVGCESYPYPLPVFKVFFSNKSWIVLKNQGFRVYLMRW